MKKTTGPTVLLLCAGMSLAVITAACSGQIGGTSSDPPPVSTGAGGTGAPLVCAKEASLAPARISVLTDPQYVNAVRDVFGVAYTGDVAIDRTGNGEYGFDENAQVSTNVAQAYQRAADQVAAKVQPCGTAAVTAACMQQYVQTKLPLAWRLPATDPAVTQAIPALMAIFNLGLPDGTPRAVQLVMEAMLGSGAFLYRTEVGKGTTPTSKGKITMTPHELATAVSFALMDSVPDAQLRAKADDGSLLTPDVLGAEVDRLLTVQAARDNLTKKMSYYLNLEKLSVYPKDPATFPEYTATLQQSLYQSAQMFVNDVLWKGKFSDLLTSTKFYANAEMAKVYNVPGVTGTGFTGVNMPAEQRGAGILSHPALLTSSNQHTVEDDIVHRGLYVYSAFACGVSVGVPPMNAGTVFAGITGTERERAIKRDEIGACGACHKSFDPFGLVTETYDPIGRFRPNEPSTGAPQETSAMIVGVGPDIDGTLRDVNDLAAKLTQSQRASDCAATHLTKFALDHDPNAENSCQLQTIKDRFAKSGSFTDLFKSMVTSPAFLTRDIVVLAPAKP